jgi:hypothetical protein
MKALNKLLDMLSILLVIPCILLQRAMCKAIEINKKIRKNI